MNINPSTTAKSSGAAAHTPSTTTVAPRSAPSKSSHPDTQDGQVYTANFEAELKDFGLTLDTFTKLRESWASEQLKMKERIITEDAFIWQLPISAQEEEAKARMKCVGVSCDSDQVAVSDAAACLSIISPTSTAATGSSSNSANKSSTDKAKQTSKPASGGGKAEAQTVDPLAPMSLLDDSDDEGGSLSPWAKQNKNDKDTAGNNQDNNGVAAKKEPQKVTLKLVGAVDISFIEGRPRDAVAALVVLRYPDLKPACPPLFRLVKLHYPYCSGFLAFREAPSLLSLIDELRNKAPDLMPQVIFVDGNGILHTRGVGLACHLGVMTGIPTIGVSKTVHQVPGVSAPVVEGQSAQLLHNRGDYIELRRTSKDETTGAVIGSTIGAAVRVAEGSKHPVFVSPGHLVSVSTAVRLTLACSIHKNPEPIRAADLGSREFVRNMLQKEKANAK